MSYQDMVGELHGTVPKIPWDLCKTYVNRAWQDLRRQNLWSFLLGDANWVSPGLINTGTATTVQGTNTVQFDATAQAVLNAVGLVPTPLIQRQFRTGTTTAGGTTAGVGTIYNIWAYNSSTGIATLDRNFAEASVTTGVYTIFQCYYPAPVQDFWGWVSVRDMVNFIDLFTDRYNREQLDAMDPQRSWYYFATDVVPYQQDQNPASPTYRTMEFELWGAPQSSLVYQLMFIRKGLPLVNPTDTLPPAVGEDCVLALARTYAYKWAEANKGDQPRNQGADFRFLVESEMAEYNRLFKQYRSQDRNLVDNWFSVKRSVLYGKFFATYNSLTATANPGAVW